jgi:hypothetical protein
LEINHVKSALVIGCAACVWDDIKAAKELAEYEAIYCVKQIGIHYPHTFDVWVTLHPEAMDGYELQRYKLGLPNGYQIVAPPSNELGAHGNKGNIARRVSYLLSQDSICSAGSGLYGAQVALHDGFDRIVLAGIPMTPEAGHFMPESKNVAGLTRGEVWTGHSAFVVGMNMVLPRMMDKVKSMSGYTKKVLGAPTQDWFRA